ncbi:hypothetical protein MPSEU_000464000 [Mayamaea pseudoterrestris]|nr:hypothetical protein MPSEU_000464000 [Mayamaea pseudoterrestris]
MRNIQLIVTSCSMLLTAGALQQEAVLYTVESFLAGKGSKSGAQAVAWLRNLLPPTRTDEDATNSVTHHLYDVSAFQSIHDRQARRGILDRFKTSTTRGGSSVLDDEDQSSTNSILAPTSHKKPYSITTTLVHGSGETSLIAGCDIIEAKQTTRLIALWDDNTPALWKTCAFLSDTLIVGLIERTTISPLLTQALQAGLVARKAQKLSKPRLVFALHSDPNSKDELNEWKEQLVINELSGISERLVDSFQVMAVDDLRTQKPKSRRGGVSKVAEPEAFPRLMEQVHSSFGGFDESLLKLTEKREIQEPLQEFSATPVEGKAPAPKQTEAVAAVETYLDATSILETALQHLELLQEQQDNASLEAQAGAMPMDFASKTAPILELIASNMSELPVEEQAVLQQQIGVHIQQLYQQQLSSLRDYYGRLYEAMLDKTDNEKEWKSSVNKVLDQFRKAAAAAVPANVKAFGELDLQYLSSCAATGLRDDMVQAMELRQTLELESDDDEGTGVSGEPKKTLPMWYKKLAARGLVLGINYFQGWLAWQGIKRAALQRERNLPKFPLF